MTATAEEEAVRTLSCTELAGTQFCEVEVDTETGEVRSSKMVSVNDCGIPVNSLTTESQVIGPGSRASVLSSRIAPSIGAAKRW